MSYAVDLDSFWYLTGLSRHIGKMVDQSLEKLGLENIRTTGDYLWLRKIDTGWELRKVPPPPFWEPSSATVLEVQWEFNKRLIMPLGFVFEHGLIGKHIVYEHSVQTPNWVEGEIIGPTTFVYVGQTKQGWQKRLVEHLRGAKAGSNTLFHRALREHKGVVQFTRLIRVGLSAEKADEVEENWVRERSLFPLGLNMIPGGKAGVRFLFEHAGPRADTSADRREETLSEVIRQSRKTGANPALSARWSDDAFAIRMICSQKNRLKPEQIETARLLHNAGHRPEVIQEMVGARSLAQTKALLSGKTYARVS